MAEWKHGFCDCFGSMEDCCIGCWCPCVHAYLANQAAGEETLMGALQLIFYPLLVPVLRNKVREAKGIDVRANKNMFKKVPLYRKFAIYSPGGKQFFATYNF
jgi:Cys-rich protein (TIGR01571 family)